MMVGNGRIRVLKHYIAKLNERDFQKTNINYYVQTVIKEKGGIREYVHINRDKRETYSF